MRRNFFLLRVSEHWNRLPRGVLEFPFLETFRIHLGLQEAKTDISMATKDEVHHVRQSPGVSEGEIKATRKRREKVLMCLEKLGIHCEKNNVPTIVVLGSGGGLRAMIALLGTLVELKKQNFLDAVTYLCGVSGSTWCMSLLYGNGKWSEKLMSLEKELYESLSNSSWHIAKAEESLEESSNDENYSLTDFWAACFVYQILQQFDENELADHKEASETGINPYPIYAAVDKEKLSEKGGNFPGTWFEFTPHEAGYTALGAFVSTRYFGSEFEKGKLKKKKKKHICYMQGLWGSALGSMEENIKFIRANIKPSYLVENKTISLIDAGLAINSAYPLVLQAQRQADLIISFDFSSGDPFETIKKTASYCWENNIPFPKIEDQKMDENNPSDCYIFRGDKSCPTVMHFPLFNNANCSGKVEDYREQFSTFQMSFPGEAIKDLLKKAGLNVSNNRDFVFDYEAIIYKNILI
ncbi:PREDICTED: cytosolic phospholipase A2 gamma [Nestor notabilis]|uniref:cytosolic phospholipase A2 gamma n=1 Tax=Nestor notabilis TaxID=176057 RepID=UPI000523A931|nr:PREDICTED: cytosolic phospholipase A2 gamma [Nestor notabilis]